MNRIDFKSIDYQLNLSGEISWKAPSNIALIKYWGKKDIQVPLNPSLSFTLKNAVTKTIVKFKPRTSQEDISFIFYFDGKKNHKFGTKVKKYLESIFSYVPFLKDYHLDIFSENNFPHSSGMASSASSMAALSLCLVSLERAISRKIIQEVDFYKRASFLARLGSGSACRSIYSKINLWGFQPEFEGVDEYSRSFLGLHPIFDNYRDAILVIDKKVKKVSSSVGHQLMNKHPFLKSRIEQANCNLRRLIHCMAIGDCEGFAEIVENEALTLHGLMMSSTPSFILMAPKTLSMIEKIRNKREQTKLPICFTLDAGANIHLLYPQKIEKEVEEFISNELKLSNVIFDEVGPGPSLLFLKTDKV